MDTNTSRQATKDAIWGMAVFVRVTPARNILRFANLFQAEQAAELFRRAGIACQWAGGNQPVLHTAADFAPKAMD